MKLSIIIINYKSEDFLKKCLQSIEKNLDAVLNFEVIVINNDNKSLDLESHSSFPLKIIQNKTNSGFGAANNLGTKNAQGDFLLFLNPDTELIDDSLLKMIEFLENNKNTGIVGPKIIEFQRQAPQPWTCGEKTSIKNILFRNTIGKPWNKKEITEVAWVSGTALLMQKELFKKLNGFDEAFFMYFEDQDLCLRAKEKNQKVFFFPQAQIVHFNGKSWKNKHSQKKEYYKSQKYFFKKHHNKISNQLLGLLHKFTTK